MITWTVHVIEKKKKVSFGRKMASQNSTLGEQAVSAYSQAGARWRNMFNAWNQPPAELQFPAHHFDYDRFMEHNGQWVEVARTPNSFQTNISPPAIHTFTPRRYNTNYTITQGDQTFDTTLSRNPGNSLNFGMLPNGMSPAPVPLHVGAIYDANGNSVTGLTSKATGLTAFGQEQSKEAGRPGSFNKEGLNDIQARYAAESGRPENATSSWWTQSTVNGWFNSRRYLKRHQDATQGQEMIGPVAAAIQRDEKKMMHQDPPAKPASSSEYAYMVILQPPNSAWILARSHHVGNQEVVNSLVQMLRAHGYPMTVIAHSGSGSSDSSGSGSGSSSQDGVYVTPTSQAAPAVVEVVDKACCIRKPHNNLYDDLVGCGYEESCAETVSEVVSEEDSSSSSEDEKDHNRRRERRFRRRH